MLIINHIELVQAYSDCTIDTIIGFCDAVIRSEQKLSGDISIHFISDEEMLQVNQEHLQHDYYTDIITFDYCIGNVLHGDLFISIDRVFDNAHRLSQDFLEELLRVIAHGLLHLCGYNDKTEAEQLIIRDKENEKLKLFHVKQ